jgi:hypothetical protein
VYQALYGPKGLVIFDHPYNADSALQDGEIAAVSRAELPVLAILRWGLLAGHRRVDDHLQVATAGEVAPCLVDLFD